MTAVLTVAVGGSTLALLGAAIPASIPGLIALAAFALLIATWDAWHVRRASRELQLTGPVLTRAFRGRTFPLSITLHNTGNQARPRHLQVAIDAPAIFEGTSTPLDFGVILLPGTQLTREAELRCLQRGEYNIKHAYVRTRSLLSLWENQTTLPLHCTIKIYPDLFADPAASEFLDRSDSGSKIRRYDGKGREFEKLREYVPGDSFDEVDWKATARRGKPVVRVFRVERTQEIYVALDASRLSGRLAGGEVTLERCVNAALVMALAAEQQGDKFGLLSFSDQVHGFVGASKGRSHFKICRELIYKLQPRAVEPDFAEFFAFLQNRVPRRALVIILTALDDPLAAETFARHVSVASRRHLVIAAMPQPEGAQPLFQAEAPDLDAMYEQLGGHLRWRHLTNLRISCKRHGVALHLLDPQQLTGQLAGVYLDVKRRQRL